MEQMYIIACEFAIHPSVVLICIISVADMADPPDHGRSPPLGCVTPLLQMCV